LQAAENSMRIARDIHQFLAEPVGSQLTTSCFSYWYPRRGLTGFALWGTPSRADVQLLNRIMDVVVDPIGDRHVSLVDMGLLGTVDPSAFRTMAEYLARRWPQFGQLIVRQALIRPSGLTGAVVAGFYEVLVPTYPVKLFTEPDAALEWLAIEGEHDLRSTITDTRATARPVDGVLGPLRVVLQQHLEDPKLPDVASKLGMSERTLQRRLRVAGTTFQREAHTARLEAAQAMMLAGGISLTRIAIELGFASLQHFSALFRKRFGSSPTEWVRRRVCADAR
jgi:AraC-like DNA-binding protein